MKKWLALLLFVLLAVLHAACGGGYSAPTAPSGPTPMPGTAATPTPSVRY